MHNREADRVPMMRPRNPQGSGVQDVVTLSSDEDEPGGSFRLPSKSMPATAVHCSNVIILSPEPEDRSHSISNASRRNKTITNKQPQHPNNRTADAVIVEAGELASAKNKTIGLRPHGIRDDVTCLSPTAASERQHVRDLDDTILIVTPKSVLKTAGSAPREQQQQQKVLKVLKVFPNRGVYER